MKHLGFSCIPRPLWAAGVVVGAFAIVAGAHAWKPTTHVHLAQKALEDVVEKDGKTKIRFERVDELGNTCPLGEFEAYEGLVKAIGQYPEKFFAGAVGPDAYPDIATGQMLLHPPRGPPASGCESRPEPRRSGDRRVAEPPLDGGAHPELD